MPSIRSKKAVHQNSVSQVNNIKTKEDLYVATLDVTRRTKLDSDWGLGVSVLKVDITMWCQMPYDYVCSKILDIVRSKDSTAAEDWVPHRAFDSNAEVHRLGLLFEIILLIIDSCELVNKELKKTKKQWCSRRIKNGDPNMSPNTLRIVFKTCASLLYSTVIYSLV